MCVVLLTLATGVSCAPLFTPTKLQSFKESREVIAVTPVGLPRLTLSPHGDGLGWTAQVTQTVEETDRIRREEVWEGYTYKRRVNLVTMLGGGLLCGPNILLNTIFSVGTPDQPGWSSPWQYCLAAMGYDVPGKVDTKTGPVEDLDPHTQILTRVLQEGELRLSFASEGKDSLGISTAVSQDFSGTPIRLRWLAQAFREHGINPAALAGGAVVITYSPPNGAPGISRAFPIDGHAFSAILQQDLIFANQRHWPRQSHFRLMVSDTRGHTQSDRFVDHFIHRLKEQGSTLVIRGDRYHSLVPVQLRQLSPLYSDEITQSVGMSTGATILVYLDIASASDYGLLFTTTMVSVETAQILAEIVLECPLSEVTQTAETLAAMVNDLALPQRGATSGWFITP